MNGTNSAFGREVFRRLVRSLGFFLTSPVGGKAKWLLAALFLIWVVNPLIAERMGKLIKQLGLQAEGA